MTRETKIGLVVAGSFLSLVGGILAMKMRSPETPAAEGAPVVAQAEPNVVAPPPNSPATTEVVAQPTILPPPNVPAVDPFALNPAAVAANPAPAPIVAPPLSEPAPVIPPPVETAPAPDLRMPPPTESPKVETPPAPVAPPPIKEVDPPAPATPDPFKSADAPAVEKKTAPPDSPTATLLPVPTIPKDPPAQPATASLQPVPTAPPTLQSVNAPKPYVPPPAPANDSYLEEEYRLREGDTFEALSRKFYFGEKYSQALRQYNRDYPTASPSMRRDPSAPLVAGTIIWIPPIRILAKRYPSLLPDMPSSAQATVTPASTPSTTPTGNVRPVSVGPKTYRVRDGGENLQEIARRLPTQDWQAIHRMNPTLNPNALVPIPGGTLLRLPADARID